MKKGIIFGIIFFFLLTFLYGNEISPAPLSEELIENLIRILNDEVCEQEAGIENEVIQNDESPIERISMLEAFNNRDGACAFRVLLAIAETRVGKNLTLEQLVRARGMYYGSTRSNNWWVTIRRADGLTQGANSALEDVINIGLELLGSDERARHLRRIIESPASSNIPSGTQATFIRVGAVSTSNFHFLEGDADGNIIYDPLHSLDYYIGVDIIGFDAIGFFTL